MDKKDLVGMFMESPFYFDLLIRERLELLKRLFRDVNPRPVNGTKTEKMTKIVVGFKPPAFAS